ncbi:winged helix-turn-helix transcriptional regulator [bacterium]|nr:winged helix-turn-helix transcriptional regulator [bacterium]
MKAKCCRKSEAKINQLIKFLKIISEKNRIKILCLLKEDEKCVCEVWQCLKLPQNLVSHHLKTLKDFNLISSRKEGVKIFYRLNKKVIRKYLKLLNEFLKD